MNIETSELQPYLQEFDFEGLFVEGLGWNYYDVQPNIVQIDDHAYSLNPVAEKAGFVVFQCTSMFSKDVPRYPIRRKIESQVAKMAFEHIVIFVDGDRKEQVWQWVRREPGKPPVCREHPYYAGQNGNPLLQRLQAIAVTLEEEPAINISAVASRVRAAMDVEKVTKRFYDQFRKELTAFEEFIDGIDAQTDRDWYASLTLNRLMFVYFIQKQGFLDGDLDYLPNRLRLVRENSGAGRFQEFYRVFLLRLFHEGLGQHEAARTTELHDLLGKVPFLNGGLFDVHDLEHDNPNISILDEAFERIFNFFDSYRWHLDERPHREDNEINPDVLGYIFEKYINQKQMGAYYTKEDITGYISRNTIIPFLFDSAIKKCPVAFEADGGVWRLLRDDPDRYIYPAVGHSIAWDASDADSPDRLGEAYELPAEITAGLSNVSQRGSWNLSAPGEYALPTETWREVVARRQRYQEVRTKLESGEVREINDLVTLNLDIEQFARDVIAQSEGPELLRAFWHAIRDVSILDPTCGSGAFLFAALNILEPLYTACLEGMQGFLDDLDRTDRPHHSDSLRDFRDVLQQVATHPNERYFILKTIVLNNLYGVDMMDEAVEICKLRLFLKLVAQLRNPDQIEPLPDIDFNIRTGNTVVGFSSLRDVRKAILSVRRHDVDQGKMVVFEDEKQALLSIEANAESASRAFNRFRQQQTALNGEVTAADKSDLRRRLDDLRSELDYYLAADYGIDREDSNAYQNWLSNNQPFHWFVEFYDIMLEGGFDVIIGNPPYVPMREIVGSYSPKGFLTEDCPDLYAMVVERSVTVCNPDGRVGMIVPINLTFGSSFATLRDILYNNFAHNWFSSFGRIPAALFSVNTRVRNTIYIGHKSRTHSTICFTTRLHRWFEAQRPTLFESLAYARYTPSTFKGLVPKIGSKLLLKSLEALIEAGNYRICNEFDVGRRGFPLDFKGTAYNWLTFCVDQPPVYDSSGKIVAQTNYKTIRFRKAIDRDLSMLLTNGKLMLLWWIAMGDDLNVTKRGFETVPLGPSQLTGKHRDELLALLPELEVAMKRNLVFKLNAGKNIGNYNLAMCRQITDKSDRAWLESLGLSHLWDEIELEHSLVVRTSFEN